MMERANIPDANICAKLHTRMHSEGPAHTHTRTHAAHRYGSDLKSWPGATTTDTHAGRRTLSSELWTTNGKAWQRQALLKMCNRH